MNCAVVTGVTGHLGQELARQLLRSGVKVHGLTRQDVGPLATGLSNFRLHRIDGKTHTLINLFSELQPTITFHLAALARREHKSSDIEPFIAANILFGTQLLEAARLSGCGNFISAGSYLQHYDTNKYCAFNLYAATKQAFENVLAFYVDEYSISAAVLVLCNIYSERDARPTLITDIATACHQGSTLVLQDRESWVDQVHVEDVAAAFVQAALLLGADTARGRRLLRYSVSSQKALTATDLVSLFERIGKRTIKIERAERCSPLRRTKPWYGTIVPGWTPRVTIEDGIERLLNARRQQ